MEKRAEKKPNHRDIHAGNLQVLQELKFLKQQLAENNKQIEALKTQNKHLTEALAKYQEPNVERVDITPAFDLKAPDFKLPGSPTEVKP